VLALVGCRLACPISGRGYFNFFNGRSAKGDLAAFDLLHPFFVRTPLRLGRSIPDIGRNALPDMPKEASDGPRQRTSGTIWRAS